jgi:hypothetical protein
VVAEASLGTVRRKLEGEPVNLGPYGPYWWVDSDFNARAKNRRPDWLV